ncbi:MAG: glycine zipper domain-containing protein [Mariprofundaceae bacterium]|nr:glycine zipper domain-containing protein [Mariprofundaceae bacterium]
MKKILLTMAMLVALFAAPFISEAGSYQQRIWVTTTTLGAATGAMIGSNRHQPLQGALIGGIIGAAVGSILAQAEPVTAYRTVYVRQANYHRVRHVDHYQYTDHYQMNRHHARLHHAGYVRSYRQHEYVGHEMREHIYGDDD